jgi:acyl carrier protein
VTQTIDVVKEVIADQLKSLGRPSATLTPSTRIMDELGIDSLGLAEIVITLESRTGKDPFALGFRHFATIEELAALYA